ncbi:MAG TPA: ABC transporter ATP-binding protein [Rhodopila sp.]|uniref:ABC transporter ATP-binding protein n=1 Tax=Rhodopila sp. TaxID=2480087 RepID=UPI002CB45B8A|nr:ABC transporter ATP-binding protein [Rhodopila sp.]HVY15802.1 ABC transporter ATP-binding protein [Rhodopila sp.]
MALASHAFRSLRLEGITREFGPMKALSDVSLTVQRGEFIALLGPSGCGKSTALNCLAGLLPLTGGAIWLDERRIDELDPEDRGFGMVFQNYALFPHMTVRRNIGFGLVSQRRPRDEIARRVDEALALVRLQAHADKLPGQLSGGQQQRVAIARAIVVEPPLVLMDEPLSNLDAKLRLEMRAEIRRIHQTLGCSTIYVTHDQDEALSLADRIVVLRDGRVRQIGTPEELYARPAHADVAEFMGYRNIIETIAAPSNDNVTVTIAGAFLGGTPIEPVNGRAVAAIRPEDLVATLDGPIAAVVEATEYRGRDFYGFARAADGTELFFRTETRLKAGETVRLAAAPERVLVYAGGLA